MLLLAATPVRAQDYPRRPIRVLEPLAAASSVDVVTRIVADRMGQILGKGLFVENEPAAAGLLGMRIGAKADPDGYTLLAVNDSVMSVLPNMRKDARYDPRTDFEPVVEMVRLHWALIASPSLGAKTVQEFIAAAKAKPGVINFASGGEGSPQHIAMELLMRQAGIKLTHVPFRGVTPALNEVVADHIPVMFDALPGPLPFLADDRLRILGVGDDKRMSTLPNTPTIAEQGLPGFQFYAWAALLAPKGTPADIVARLNSAAVTALHDPKIEKQLTDLGYEVIAGTPGELKTLIAQDFDQKGKLLKEADIHAD